ncbi:MarR family transcriptional regulator [Sphingomonas psychrotolerans]|uniref:MarR family transcriptional regulator n=1 Tax=Sphingomonas psychrotolerans TaxID=1327635 RepID=A0ABU3N4T4_9SPHN|nr:MarR family transcriptional regulator [Sphingomonas psychrotolerans]MDT8758330.1 MarR family transcriptional regulator [Sphingomonas psychrotolerans]
MTESLGFLVSDVARLMRRRFDERARKSGATGPQWRTLKILERHEGLNQGQIAELLEVEPITCCRMIDRLEEAGLVERRRDPADRRAWRIYLTEKARPVLAELHDIAGAMLEAALNGLDAPQRDALIASLNVVRANMTQTADIKPETKEAANG